MRHLTIVYAVPDDYDVSQLTGHELVSAMSWCHAIDEKKTDAETLCIPGKPKTPKRRHSQRCVILVE